MTSDLSLPLPRVLKADQPELGSDCDAGVPLPFGSLSVTRTVFILKGVTFFFFFLLTECSIMCIELTRGFSAA